MRIRGATLITSVAIVMVASLAAVLAWRWQTAGTRAAPLEPGWEAVVGTIAGTFPDPFGVAAAADGTVFVADAGEAPRILRIGVDGLVHTVAGGARGFADGDGAAARFDTPSAIAIGGDGALYVADTGNHAIRRVSPDGAVTTIAGMAGAGAVDGDAAGARFDTPCGVAVDAAGNIYLADTGNGAVRRIDASGVVSTLAAQVDGTAVRPIGIAAGPHGMLFVSDERGRVVEIAPDLRVRTLAGSIPGFRDGTGSEARFRRTAGLALAGEGRVVVADPGNGVIRLVAAPSRTPLRLPRSPVFRPAFDREAFEHTPLLWPIAPMDGPYEVAGTMGEARGIEGAERFHAGLDVRIEQGTWVRAVREGTVTSPISTGDFGSLNEWLRIGPLGYVHVRAGRSRTGELVDHDRFVPGFDADGKLSRVRVRRGTRFAAGEVIASVNPFNHVHLNVGPPGEEVNPLALRLPHFEDGIAPTIAAGGILLYDQDWQPIRRQRRQPPLLSGLVRVVVDGWDQADGNRPNRRLGLYSLGYEVLKPDGSAAPGFEHPRQTIEFDRLALQPDAAALVYAPGSGIPFYRGRRTRFLYIVTNTFRDGAASEGFWDTSSLPPGAYTLRIHARDVRGNEAIANRDLRVEIGDRR